MTETLRVVENIPRDEQLKSGEIDLGNYPSADCGLSRETRYSIGYGPTADEYVQDLLESGQYERVRTAAAYDTSGNVLHDSERIIGLPKVTSAQE